MSHPNPHPYAGCYVLHLYCARWERATHQIWAHEFTGPTLASAIKAAREKGWTIDRKTRTATCPNCSAH